MWYAALAAVLVAADQWSKYWTVSHLALEESAPLLPGFMELLRIHNYGAAWSSFAGMRWLLVGVTAVIIALVALLPLTGRVRHPLGRLACTLIAAGGAGNIIDRLRLGYVVDMLHFTFWPSYPVFNAADICVVTGAVMGVIYYVWIYEKYDRVKK